MCLYLQKNLEKNETAKTSPALGGVEDEALLLLEDSELKEKLFCPFCAVWNLGFSVYLGEYQPWCWCWSLLCSGIAQPGPFGMTFVLQAGFSQHSTAEDVSGCVILIS